MAEQQTKIEWSKLMEEALTAPGNLGNTYSRFHDYSITNELLFLIQGLREPVASYSRWKSLGRQVRGGARASEVIVPVMVNEDQPDPLDPSKRERVQRLVGFKAVRAVFGVSQTDGKELPPVKTPGWDTDVALDKLGIRRVPFQQVRGDIQGYSRGVEIAVNEVAVNPLKTTIHELGHVVLGHTLPHHFEEYQTHRGIMEFQAEATAYIVMNELEQLDDKTAEVSRGYIRHWLKDETPSDQAIRQVFTAADRILRAGRIPVRDTLPSA